MIVVVEYNTCRCLHRLEQSIHVHRREYCCRTVSWIEKSLDNIIVILYCLNNVLVTFGNFHPNPINKGRRSSSSDWLIHHITLIYIYNIYIRSVEVWIIKRPIKMSRARFQNYQRDFKKFNSYIIHRHKHFCNRATLVIALCHNTYYGEPRRSRLSGANAHNETSNAHTRTCKK